MFAPVFNSIKFIDPLAVGFLERFLQSDFSNLPYMESENYCQKMHIDETFQIQWHTDDIPNTIEYFDIETDTLQGSFTTTDVGGGEKRDENGDLNPFRYYQADISFTINGNFYIIISDGTDTLRSEPIQVSEFPNSRLLQFTNWKNTNLNIWENGFTVSLRIDCQFYRRTPSSINKILIDSENFQTMTSQRQMRGMELQVYQLPPYLHEQLAVCWSLSQCRIQGQPFYSEVGYDGPDYYQRFNLANGNITVLTSKGFNQHIGIPPTVEIPVNLMAIAISTSVIELMWQNGGGATSYELESSLSYDGPFSQIFAGSMLNFENFGLTIDTQYFYRVRGIGPAGTSAWSAIVSATTNVGVQQIANSGGELLADAGGEILATI